ncbi:MAG TPA: aldo/keto reductase [Thermoleophilaceae bacterium]|nr:aldo/keto reductase [Thermoleophilaceae bacterium]
MRYRRLGRTGIEVSEIGYGAWGIGGAQWGGADDDESIQALHRAIDLGLNFIDTALAYGEGRSERLVGQVVRERDETVHVATKVPPKNRIWPAGEGAALEDVFPPGHVRECAEQSLRNLGMDSVDVLQLHVWNDDWADSAELFDEVGELRSSGKIRFFGVSINDHQPANGVRLVEGGAVDTVQVIYNVFDQSPEDELLPACRERGVGVIARVPLDEGGLTGRIDADTEFEGDDFRAHYFRGDRRREVHERVSAIASDLDSDVTNVAEAALRFILGEPAVSTVIPGMRSLRNVERNIAASDAGPLPDEERDKLRAHRWVRNFYE